MHFPDFLAFFSSWVLAACLVWVVFEPFMCVFVAIMLILSVPLLHILCSQLGHPLHSSGECLTLIIASAHFQPCILFLLIIPQILNLLSKSKHKPVDMHLPLKRKRENKTCWKYVCPFQHVEQRKKNCLYTTQQVSVASVEQRDKVYVEIRWAKSLSSYFMASFECAVSQINKYERRKNEFSLCSCKFCRHHSAFGGSMSLKDIEIGRQHLSGTSIWTCGDEMWMRA